MKTKFTVSYAQNREDIILEGFFASRQGKPGFYVDIGAGHFFLDSVTKNLYDKGWHGINIDPIDHIYKALEEHRKRDTNLNIGISNAEGMLHFREYATDGYSTFSPDMQQQYVKTPNKLTEKYFDYDVPARTLKSVLAEFKATDIQFLKIDVEGYEYEVIESNDWEKYRPEVICVEANHVNKDWRAILRKQEYGLAYFDGLNEYYVDRHRADVIKFSYVDAVIGREPIVRYDTYAELLDQEQQLTRYKEKQARLEQEVARLTEQLTTTKARLERMHRTLPYLKMRAGRVVRRAQQKRAQKKR